MRKAFGCALLAGLFLLMLSALVVYTPGEAAPVEPPLSPARVNAALLPAPQAAPEQTSQAPARPIEARDTARACVVAPAYPSISRDANGRVLTAPRYAQSVYQVFRPEVAGG